MQINLLDVCRCSLRNEALKGDSIIGYLTSDLQSTAVSSAARNQGI